MVGWSTALAAWMFAGTTAPDLTLEWDAPAECPTEDEARQQIARGLDEDAGGPLSVRARVRQIAEDWTVEVEIDGPQGQGQRVLHARTCAEATAAAAVVVAIAVDPKAVEQPAAEVPEPAPDEPTPVTTSESDTAPESLPGPELEVMEPERIDVAPSDQEDDQRPPRALALALELRGGAAIGAVGPIAGHVGGTVGLQGEWWQVDAGARYRTPTEVDADGIDAGGRFAVLAAQLGAGPRIDLGKLEIPIRAGLELGRVRAEGYGDIDAATAVRLWTAAVLSAGAAWSPRDVIALGVGVDGVVPLLRPGFTIGDIDVLTVGSVALRAWIGVALRFSLTKRTSAGNRQASS